MTFTKTLFSSVFFLFLFLSLIEKEENKSVADTCLSEQEVKLYNLINAYRKEKGLPKIPLSKSMTFVAQTHARDLSQNTTDTGMCNAHSWSAKGKWTSCCYTPDHKQHNCMWNKPRELTTYTGDGFEIAYYCSSGVIPEQALGSWKKSKGHNAVVINGGIWKEDKWKAVGIGIYKNYATVWFGIEADKAGEAKKCVK